MGLCGAVFYRYVSTSLRAVETLQQDRPLGGAKLTADQATLVTLRTAVDAYRAEHGRLPADRAAVLALLPGPPRFQCPGNDVDYDPADGSLHLRIDDPARC